MSRTVINVAGDLTATIVMNRWIGGKSGRDNAESVVSNTEAHAEKTGDTVLIQ
jgi:Na+/H+-dicarboxylate symporter